MCLHAVIAIYCISYKKEGDLFFGIGIRGFLFFKLVEDLRQKLMRFCGIQVEFFEHSNGC